MKRKIKWSIMMLFVCSVLFCMMLPAAAKSEYLTNKKLSMLPGSVRTVTLKGTSKKVQFKVSNPKVVSIKVKGRSAVIKAKKAGKATLTATVSGKKYTCAIRVITEKQFKAQKGMGVFWRDSQTLLAGDLKGIDGIVVYKKLPSGTLKRIKKLPSGHEDRELLGGKFSSVTAKNYKQIYFRGYVKINNKTIFTRLNSIEEGLPSAAYIG